MRRYFRPAVLDTVVWCCRDMDDMFLSGTLPTEIGLLTMLTKLNLADNSLSDDIPTELGALTLLEELCVPQPV
jgi:Leucine-rich repeat (LRR) protein